MSKAFKYLLGLYGASGGGGAMRGYTGLENCTGGGSQTLVTVKFPYVVNFTETGAQGVSIFTSSDGGLTPIKQYTFTNGVGNGGDSVAYVGNWNTPTVAGDKVYYQLIDASSDYSNADGQIPNQLILMTNCLDTIGIPAGAITEPLTGDYITEPLTGDYITQP